MKNLFVSLVTVLTILSIPTAQVHADALSVGSAMNELQYRLNVEWDQTDTAKQTEIYASFTKKIEALRAAGLTDEQLLDQVAIQSGNPQSAKDLKVLATYARDHHLDTTQINDVVSQYVNDSSSTGAHWTGKGGKHHHRRGGVIVGVIVGVVVIAVVIAVICHNRGNDGGVRTIR